jgi:hypothetical protein
MVHIILAGSLVHSVWPYTDRAKAEQALLLLQDQHRIVRFTLTSMTIRT